MKRCLSRIETLAGCGFERDPFKNVNFKTGDALRIKSILKMAVNSSAMVSVIGDRGMGKTEAINTSLNQLQARQVSVRSADKDHLLITDIEYAMIFDLSDETPKRGREIRARQLRRILGEASSKQNIVLVIEEGHRLHGQTLRALKTLREMDWMGKTELFSVVLVGQSDPMSKRGVSEVRLRSDSVYMRGLTKTEVAGYIQSTVGSVFTDDAIHRISELAESSNFLELQEVLVCLMGDMLGSGEEKVTEDAVNTMFSVTQENVPKPRSTPKPKAKPADPMASGNSAIRDILNKRNGAEDGGEDEKKVVNG